jgi:hypothetical protein
MPYTLFSSSPASKCSPSPQNNRPSAWYSVLRLKACSPFFEFPINGICPDAKSFISALNTLAVAHRSKNTLPDPRNGISDTITKDGVIAWYAEILHFGLWLMVEGQPGKSVTRGQQPDAESILRSVAVALSLHFQREAYLQATEPEKPPKCLLSPRTKKKAKSNKITRTDMAKLWKKMFLEELPVGNFKSRMNTAHKSLDCYLTFLLNRLNENGELESRTSKHLDAVLDAIAEAPAKETAALKTVRQS